MTAQPMSSPIVPIRLLDDEPPVSVVRDGLEPDPGLVILTCANCGAAMTNGNASSSAAAATSGPAPNYYY